MKGYFMSQYPYIFRYDMLVNRSHRLEESYVPCRLTAPAIPFDAVPGELKRLMEDRAAQAAEKLFSAARQDGYPLMGVSGYRPYARQQALYENAGDKRYVAPPGASEHQTGLALDVSCAALDFDLTEDFAALPEGRWLAANAHLYGFILRYPKDREEITGYAWEPWHIRYVTKSLSIYLTLTGLTLEEYHCQCVTAPSAAP